MAAAARVSPKTFHPPDRGKSNDSSPLHVDSLDEFPNLGSYPSSKKNNIRTSSDLGVEPRGIARSNPRAIEERFEARSQNDGRPMAARSGSLPMRDRDPHDGNPDVGLSSRRSTSLSKQHSRATANDEAAVEGQRDATSAPCRENIANENGIADVGRAVGSKARSWKDVTMGLNPQAKFGNPNRKRKLRYMEPTIINGEKKMIISEDAYKRSSGKWKNSIVIYVFGAKPYYIHIKAYIKRVWKPTGDFEVFARDNGFFFIKFSNMEDCERILEGGPYLFDSRLVFVQRWRARLKFNRDLLTSMPIWVRFYLDLDLWDDEIISIFASYLGVPMELDVYTENESKLTYARVLIEMSANSTFPKVAKASLFNGEELEVKVEYEYNPSRCHTCNIFGHWKSQCKKKVKEVWIPKNGTETKKADKEKEIDAENNVKIPEDITENVVDTDEHSEENDEQDDVYEDVRNDSVDENETLIDTNTKDAFDTNLKDPLDFLDFEYEENESEKDLYARLAEHEKNVERFVEENPAFTEHMRRLTEEADGWKTYKRKKPGFKVGKDKRSPYNLRR